MKGLPNHPVGRDQGGEEPRNGKGVKADDPFQKPIIEEGVLFPLHEAAEKETPQGQPPPMKEVKTVLTARVVEPKMRISILSHRTS
jgi:hypothetical protein